MTATEAIVQAGDRVKDPLDGRWRTVVAVDGETGEVSMADGGIMGIGECAEVRLPSEQLD